MQIKPHQSMSIVERCLFYSILIVLLTSCLTDDRGLHQQISGIPLGCTTTNSSGVAPKIEVYFINLDRSHDRRRHMEDQLEFYGFVSKHRVRAASAKDVIVPQEISSAKHCLSALNSSILHLIGERALQTTAPIDNNDTKVVRAQNFTKLQGIPDNSHKIIVTSLCGRPKNSRRELIVTLSHLRAIRTAIYSESTDPYALILEDDTSIAFDADFVAMANTAPEGFGILQLVTSNDHELKILINKYEKDPKQLWVLRGEQDFWCAGAYLINKAVMKPLIDAIFRDLPHGWTGIAVTAGYGPPCFPRNCCHPKGRITPNFIPIPPCVNAPRGYQSDHYLFRLALDRTYMSTVQLFTSAACSNVSTLHQDHVSLHQGAFNRINSHISDIENGRIPAPPFINAKCRFIAKG